MWDRQTTVGIMGQLAGHSIVWGADLASGKPVSSILTSDTLFWAAFQVGSELLSGWATEMSGTQVAGIAVPAGVQGFTLNMYHGRTRDAIGKLSGAQVSALLDDPALLGTVVSVLAKSYTI
jgi:hypothetical protein